MKYTPHTHRQISVLSFIPESPYFSNYDTLAREDSATSAAPAIKFEQHSHTKFNCDHDHPPLIAPAVTTDSHCIGYPTHVAQRMSVMDSTMERYSSSTLSAWTWTFAWSFSSLIWWHLISQKSSQSGTRRASLSFVCPCAYYSTHPGASHFASHPDKPQRHRSLCDASDSRASRARENRRCLASPLPTPLTLPMRRALCAPSRARCT